MFPNLSQADCDAIESRWDDVRDEVARSRQSRDLAVPTRVRDWGVSRLQALGMLATIVLFSAILFWPWLSQRLVFSEPAPGPGITLVTGEAEPGEDAAPAAVGQPPAIPGLAPVAMDGADQVDAGVTGS